MATRQKNAPRLESCAQQLSHLKPQITRSNITKLLSSDSTGYDIAEDASQWQTTLRAIYRHVVASDFKHS